MKKASHLNGMHSDNLLLPCIFVAFCGSAVIAYRGQFITSEVVPSDVAIVQAAPEVFKTDLRYGKGKDESIAPIEHQSRASEEFARRFREMLDLGNLRSAIDALTAWTETDPSAASADVEKMPPGLLRDRLLREVARAWAAQDPATALVWAAQHSDSVKDQLVAAISDEVGKVDPQQALTIVERSDLGRDCAMAKERLVERWAEKDPSAAMKWAFSQPEGTARNQFVAEVASVQARTSPLEAARLVIQNIPEGAVQDNAILATLNQWARHDRAAAAAWINQWASDDPLRKRATAELITSQMEYPSR